MLQSCVKGIKKTRSAENRQNKYPQLKDVEPCVYSPYGIPQAQIWSSLDTQMMELKNSEQILKDTCN